MLFSFHDLEKIFKNHHHINHLPPIERVTTDSRVKAPNSLFIPIVGENFNGHDYVEQAIENGAIAVIWDEKEQLPASIPNDFPVFFTTDTTKGLQDLAAEYRNRIDPIVIGITGSNGKTTTKDLVSAIVKTTYRTHATLGNFNNQIGLPLTILDMPEDTEVLVLELGMSGFGEIDLLTNIAKPDYAIITNIGESHIEFLGSRQGIAKAKLEIVNGLKEDGCLIVDGDEQLLQEIQPAGFRMLRCGFSDDNDMQVTRAEVTLEGTSFSLSNGSEFQVPLFGEHHAKNAAYAIQIGEQLKIPLEKQKAGISSLAYTSMRFELLQAENGATVVNDSYNASPTSMKAAIEVIKQMDGFATRILVLGDVLELGTFADEMHRSIATVISSPITHLYTYGNHAKLIKDNVNNRAITCQHFETKTELVVELKKQLTEDCLVLFKASRGLEFESMVNEIVIEHKNEEQ
ncbi:UDP-N-acetylmuramoyl-tripeptide--D-alanyl-D-alanine ligase [Oceanobacillus luteolus]|uniref:UDP-N-acetylmuramoyl-tripeptide--D-alanyl-D-alanine ligase n=1 Tax=Oceanobacillus luteolus TaxID=1274358 RepID=A0ABW4HR32_9BACI|nr:UDP-N-acetylmuramoyl-tripeptide--D-alanyl-D-alanine ligase [Oceanobacillus luteolus]MCM3739135.1 UDP-N-acetylmuramoyl-tripeptide--D-alanyl-D-alanine ligase [Oceanobacillus luteolus]